MKKKKKKKEAEVEVEAEGEKVPSVFYLNKFPVRPNGPMHCDLGGLLRIDLDGEIKKIYVFSFTNSNLSVPGEAIAHYKFVNLDGTLRGDAEQMNINVLLELLGRPERKRRANESLRRNALGTFEQAKAKIKKKNGG